MPKNKGLPWELRRRGLKDSLRHDQRVKEAIKKNLRELISEEAIITSDGKKTIKIPIRYLDQYRFKYGQPANGVGQGGGNPGDVLLPGNKGDNGHGDGLAGEEAGKHMFEVEVSLEELTQMMLADLNLPWLEQKPQRQSPVVTHRYTDIRRTGSLANLDKRRSLLTNVKRNAARDGRGKVRNLHEDDLRYRTWDEYEEPHTNAAVYMLMDCSASMTTERKYIAQSFFFWMVQFLRQKYDKVETVFIAHDVEASVVAEKEFFTLTSAGGTRCSSAYVLAERHMLAHHPTNSWNTYLFHISDGDNIVPDNVACKGLVEQLLRVCRMVGYAEIRYDSYSYQTGNSYAPSSLQGVLGQIAHPHFVRATIANKDAVYDTLRSFLKLHETPAV